MHKALKIGLFVLLLPQPAWAQLKAPTLWQPADSLNKTRLYTYAYGGGALAVGSLIGLYSIWYADYEQSGFHFTNDNQNWGGMDKIGHAMTTYAVGQLSYDMLKWSGVSEKKSVWYGGLTGWTYLAIVEVMDGFSAEWGFSWGDMAFNTAGAALFIGQQIGWKDQKFLLKYSYSPTDYPQYRKDLLGDGWQEEWLKDYNGQTYWLSASPRAFTGDALHWWPRWLCLSGGYGIDGFVSADGGPLPGAEQITSQRQYYLSFDIDLRQIPMKSGFWKTLLHTISFIKIPAPTLEFNEHAGGTRFYWLYF
jgi:uncharacterized protein YfiM (DUF2279 family)